MAKHESTAINELIHLAARRPVHESNEELLFHAPVSARLRGQPEPGRAPAAISPPSAPLPRRRTPMATPQQVLPTPRPQRASQSPPRRSPPVEVDAESTEFRPTMRFDRELPTAPVESITATAAVRPLAMPVARPPSLRHQLIATVERFAVPIAVGAMLVVALAGYLALSGDEDPQAIASSAASTRVASSDHSIDFAEITAAREATEVAAPEPAAPEPAAPELAATDSAASPSPAAAPLWQPRTAQPTILPPGTVPAAPADTNPQLAAALSAALAAAPAADLGPSVAEAMTSDTAPVVAAASPHVAVRIESTPQGATAMLIDSGATSVLGTTPLDASLDPARTYEIVLSMPGHETRVAKVDPAVSQQVAIVFAETEGLEVAREAPTRTLSKGEASRASKRARAAKARQQIAAAERARRTGRSTRSDRKLPTQRTERAPTKVAVVKLAAGDKGAGKLSVTASVPAMIYVDGRSTGLTTPQQLSLSAGAHKITLLDPKSRKAKTTTVEIVAKQSAKLDRRF